MKYLLIAILLFVLVILVSSCPTSKKLDLIKPEPDNAEPVEYETTTSFIHLPITIQLKDIENQTNKLLNGLIYNDSILKDDDFSLQKCFKFMP